MNRLIDIGFHKVGEWKMLSEGISPNLTDLANSSNILYSFISDGEALYVGKTTQTLQKILVNTLNMKNTYQMSQPVTHPVRIFTLWCSP